MKKKQIYSSLFLKFNKHSNVFGFQYTSVDWERNRIYILKIKNEILCLITKKRRTTKKQIESNLNIENEQMTYLHWIQIYTLNLHDHHHLLLHPLLAWYYFFLIWNVLFKCLDKRKTTTRRRIIFFKYFCIFLSLKLKRIIKICLDFNQYRIIMQIHHYLQYLVNWLMTNAVNFDNILFVINLLEYSDIWESYWKKF